MNSIRSLFSPDPFLSPTLSTSTQDAFRLAYAILLVFTLLQAWPQRRRFFCSERWGGYAESSPAIDRIQNPWVASLLLIAWMGFGILLMFNLTPVAAALGSMVLARYFFIRMRWKSVLRGMGAPGFMTYWLSVVVFLLEFTKFAAPSARALAVVVAQIDFALIMFSAGIYKLTAGYAANEGMEYGLVNPEWGYWWRAYRRIPPRHFLFRLFNHLAWGTEVVAAILMLVPSTRLLGAAVILVSFVFIALQIRLGFLCEMVIAATLLFFFDGSLPASFLERVLSPPATAPVVVAGQDLFAVPVEILLWTYLTLLPLAHAGLFYNFYARKRLPRVLQQLLERYTNALGLIIWRVFSVDVVNFYILIHRQPRDRPTEATLVSTYGWRGGLRFNHVGESIAITSIFTTLKYYPSNSALFRDRLIRYARTVPCAVDDRLRFEYVSIVKEHDRFASRAVASYLVDPHTGTIAERVLDPSFSVHAPHSTSPVHEGIQPGTYVPLRA